MIVVDYQGVSVLIAAIVAAVVSLGNAFQNWRAKKTAEANKTEAIASRANLVSKVDAVAATVDGHATEQVRKIEALSAAVASQSRGGVVPEQTAGEAGNAPVGISEGVVTVERREAAQRSTDAPAVIPIAPNADQGEQG